MASVFRAVMGKIIGLVIFFIVLAILNLAVMPDASMAVITAYLNSSILIVIVFSIMFLLAELSFTSSQPIRLTYPVWNAVGSVFVVMFLFGMLSLFLLQSPAHATSVHALYIILLFLVPLIVLGAGYGTLLFKPKSKPTPKKRPNDIGAEFNNLVLDMIRKARKWLK